MKSDDLKQFFNDMDEMETWGTRLTKRELFAAMAMQGLRSGDMRAIVDIAMGQQKTFITRVLAELAVEQADALIAALEANR